MHHPSHPFRLIGQLSRSAYNYWKNVTSRQPLVRRVQSALFWLPTMTVFTQVGCTIRAVTGNSMQVRIPLSVPRYPFISPLLHTLSLKEYSC
jgi:hypothetical protein